MRIRAILKSFFGLSALALGFMFLPLLKLDSFYDKPQGQALWTDVSSISEAPMENGASPCPLCDSFDYNSKESFCGPVDMPRSAGDEHTDVQICFLRNACWAGDTRIVLSEETPQKPNYPWQTFQDPEFVKIGLQQSPHDVVVMTNAHTFFHIGHTSEEVFFSYSIYRYVLRHLQSSGLDGVKVEIANKMLYDKNKASTWVRGVLEALWERNLVGNFLSAPKGMGSSQPVCAKWLVTNSHNEFIPPWFLTKTSAVEIKRAVFESLNLALPAQPLASHKSVLLVNRPKNTDRIILNGDEIGKYLTQKCDLEFKEVFAAEEGLEEQVRLFMEPDIIIVAHGAAESNILWMKPGSILIEIFPWGYRIYFYHQMATMLPLRHEPILLDDKSSIKMHDKCFVAQAEKEMTKCLSSAKCYVCMRHQDIVLPVSTVREALRKHVTCRD